MKIDLKINNDKIIAVHGVLQKIHTHNLTTATVNAKVIASIWLDLADKFEKKYNEKVRGQDIFSDSKLTKFSLKYHQAWALKNILIDFQVLSDTDFQKLQLQKVINSLDQKLQ